MSKRDEDEDERESDAPPEGEGEAAGSDSSESSEDDSGSEDSVADDASSDGDAAGDGAEDEAARVALALRGATDEASEAGEGDELANDLPEGVVPTQLGVQRYVFSAFSAVGIIVAYVIGQLLFTLWANFANRDFFALNLPTLAAVPDDSKETYALLVAGVLTLGYVFRAYRKPDVRQWADDVAGELVKVKWPSRKEVTSATIVVLTTSAIATLYLFVLDQFWSFLTNLVYGTGS
jgi:preprotein translocase subunit SecE